MPARTSERMSEDMPDRILEDMLEERLSEDMPTRISEEMPKNPRRYYRKIIRIYARKKI